MAKNASAMQTMQEIWGATLHAGDDPALTVHRLPNASHDDLNNLGRTILQSDAAASGRRVAATMLSPSSDAVPEQPSSRQTVLDTSLRERATLPRAVDLPPGTPPPDSGEGVAGQDFFAIAKELGKGGMGVVYSARQVSLDRSVAVKTMREGGASPQQRAAFLREALTTGALAHPNIVPVHLFGRDKEGRLFLVMKHVSGRPWNKVLKTESEGKSGFDLGKHLDIFQKVCDAVAFAHARCIVHRDLKPENVMIGDYGEVTVMDWGLALDVSGKESPAISREKATTIAGTPAYMAPEMALAQLDRIGPWTDIYLLGAILYELVTGNPPHTGRTVFEVLEHAAFGKVENLVPREKLPREVRDLERILRKAMALEPEQRYASVAELQTDLRSFQAGQGDRTESDALARTAREELTALAKDSDGLRLTSSFYARCGEILAKTQQALALWGFNPRAVRVRQETLALYADLAVRGRDWGLAEAHLRDLRLSGAGGAALANPVEQRLRANREAWNRRQALFVRATRTAAVFFFVTLGLSLYLYTRMNVAKIELEQEQKKVEELQAALEAAPTPAEPPERPKPSPLPHATKTPQPAETPQKDPLPAPIPAEAAAEETWWVRLNGDRATPPAQGNAAPLCGLTLNGQGQALLWDRRGGAWIWQAGARPPKDEEALFARDKLGKISAAAWVDEKTVALADERGTVHVGDSPDRPWNTPLRLNEPIQALAARRMGREILLAAATAKGVVLCRGSEQMRVESAEPVQALGFFPDGALVIATAKKVEIRKLQEAPVVLGLGDKGLAHIAFASRARMLAMVVSEKPTHVQIVSPDNPNALSIGFPRSRINAVAISPDGSLVVAASDSGELMIVAGGRARMLQPASMKGVALTEVSLSADARKAYTLDERHGVREWKLEP
ncbi:MAG: protein kinase [Planctomycetota bacterium]|nr:protein kinase [Planctomycetota bacterium]